MELLDCGHVESPHGEYTSGYGYDRAGKRYCYDCCSSRDMRHMEETGEICAYLASDGKTVTGWPGFVLLHVTREWVTSAGGFARHTAITRVWARDRNGNMWHGRGLGRGMYMRLRRSVDKRGRAR